MTSTAPLKRFACTLAALALLSVVFAGSSSAATSIGSKCLANGALNNAYVDTTLGTSPVTGVITKWGFSFPAAPPTYPQQLMVLTSDGSGGWTVTAVDAPLAPVPGLVERAARLPIMAGQAIGSWGSAGTLVCAGVGTSSQFPLAVAPTVGTNLTGGVLFGATPALFAEIEPDVDGDGFGDETQDLCTASAQVQTICPIPTVSFLRLPSASGLKGYVTTSVASSTRAVAKVKLPAAKGKRARTITFRSKVVNTDSGKISRLSLKWPKSLSAALKKTRKRLSVAISIEATARDGGLVGTKKLTVKVRGGG